MFIIILWFRDLLRELYKNYEILYINLLKSFTICINSEILLFLSLFWSIFFIFFSPSLNIPNESIFIPDPCQLTITNTLLLSNAAINIDNYFINLEIIIFYFTFFLSFSLLLSLTFMTLQIKEFSIMALLINDSIYSCLFFFITGLHFFHIIFVLLLISLIFYHYSRILYINEFQINPQRFLLD